MKPFRQIAFRVMKLFELECANLKPQISQTRHTRFLLLPSQPIFNDWKNNLGPQKLGKWRIILWAEENPSCNCHHEKQKCTTKSCTFFRSVRLCHRSSTLYQTRFPTAAASKHCGHHLEWRRVCKVKTFFRRAWNSEIRRNWKGWSSACNRGNEIQSTELSEFLEFPT